MTSGTLIRPEVPRPRSVELVLAHAHLRLGLLALARTELETLAGLGRLGAAGLVDLAEARWRTGDMVGAGEAAAAALRDASCMSTGIAETTGLRASARSVRGCLQQDVRIDDGRHILGFPCH